MTSIFEMHGVCVVNLIPHEDYFRGQFRVTWIETGNRLMVDIFEYEDLPSRKTALADALKRASGALQFTPF